MTIAMGWTHSWRRPVELPADRFACAAADLRLLAATNTVELAGFDGTGHTQIDADHIVFNGRAPSKCEPFEIARVEFDRLGGNEVRAFCKTEHLPYDLIVQSALIILKHHLDDAFSVSSDGYDADWNEAKRLVARCLGYGADFELQTS